MENKMFEATNQFPVSSMPSLISLILASSNFNGHIWNHQLLLAQRGEVADCEILGMMMDDLCKAPSSHGFMMDGLVLWLAHTLW